MIMPRSDSKPETIRAIARLPGLTLDIVHRRPSDDVEQISINLQATPSFDVFARWVEMAWLPWLGFARMMMLPLAGCRGAAAAACSRRRHSLGGRRC
jgi:hypothetical protein